MKPLGLVVDAVQAGSGAARCAVDPRTWIWVGGSAAIVTVMLPSALLELARSSGQGLSELFGGEPEDEALASEPKNPDREGRFVPGLPGVTVVGSKRGVALVRSHD